MIEEEKQEIKKGFNPLYFQRSKDSEATRIKKEEDRLIKRHRPQRVRICKSDFLERFTLVEWQSIFIFWIPVICYLFYLSYRDHHLSATSYAMTFISGVLFWTLAEYLIHRFPFHLHPKSDWAKKIVYTAHGNHHDDPFDPLRGVMPIVPAIFYLVILYGVFYAIIPMKFIHAFFASFLIGYLLYDGIHYYTHHGKPKNKVLKYLRRIHLVHHVHDDIMFGISSPLWDIIFKTYSKPGYKAPKEF
ncbi:MAG: fatty acid hydroxylase [Bacteriovoracaceae bacterium]|nr:fatty acid hydroxylase [Bacteriovoracaceae bacterium]